MSKPVRHRPMAETDITVMADYLHTGSPRASLAFLDALEAAYGVLSTHPASGSPRHGYVMPELPVPLRFHPIKGFERILVYYLDLPDAVEVIRVWDAARGLEALMQDSPGDEPSQDEE